MACPDCEKPSVFNQACELCRARYLNQMPCKKERGEMAKHLDERYGDLGVEDADWQQGVQCSCTKETGCHQLNTVRHFKAAAAAKKAEKLRDDAERARREAYRGARRK